MPCFSRLKVWARITEQRYKDSIKDIYKQQIFKWSAIVFFRNVIKRFRDWDKAAINSSSLLLIQTLGGLRVFRLWLNFKHTDSLKYYLNWVNSIKRVSFYYFIKSCASVWFLVHLWKRGIQTSRFLSPEKLKLCKLEIEMRLGERGDEGKTVSFFFLSTPQLHAWKWKTLKMTQSCCKLNYFQPAFPILYRYQRFYIKLITAFYILIFLIERADRIVRELDASAKRETWPGMGWRPILSSALPWLLQRLIAWCQHSVMRASIFRHDV